MKKEFTPGPWELHETGAIVGPKIDDKPVWLRPVIARFETGVKQADAHLIAAAPDLLEALELVKAWDIENLALDIPQEIREKMQAALSKARGE